jgi:hypothetical protein
MGGDLQPTILLGQSITFHEANLTLKRQGQLPELCCASCCKLPLTQAVVGPLLLLQPKLY